MRHTFGVETGNFVQIDKWGYFRETAPTKKTAGIKVSPCRNMHSEFFVTKLIFGMLGIAHVKGYLSCEARLVLQVALIWIVEITQKSFFHRFWRYLVGWLVVIVRVLFCDSFQ